MKLVDQLRGNFPKTIDKSRPVFSALIANENGDASIQKQLEDLLAYMKEWTSTPDIYEQTGVMLDKTVRFFSFLERFADETEESLKNRFRAIFVRNHNTKWGTAFDVKSVFKQYFPSATIYLAENVNKIDDENPELANLLQDGDIDTDSISDYWTMVNCAATKNARFSKGFGVEMNQSGGSLSQTVSLKPSTPYFLHFFMKGECNVIIKDSDDKYYSFESKEWGNSEVKNGFTTEKVDAIGNIESYEWANKDMFFITTATANAVTITFEMKGVGQKANVGVKFTIGSTLDADTVIPAGTRVCNSDESLTFITTEEAVISAGQTSSNLANAEADDYGFEYIVAEHTITKDLDDLSVTVDNPHEATGGTYLDYFRLFEKQPYGSFSVIAHFEGNVAGDAFGLAGGDDDPNIPTTEPTPPQPRYSNYGYYDKSYLSGVPLGFATDIYEDVLDYLRAQGVKAYLEIVIRDYSGDQE